MAGTNLTVGTKVAIHKAQLNQLIRALQESGYQTIGPKVGDTAITYGEVNTITDFPQGYVDEQERGFYRIKRGQYQRFFDFTPGPDSMKKYLFPPRSELFSAHRENGSWKTSIHQEDIPRYAFIGIRPCELAAVDIQDNVFIRGDYVDPIYKTRRMNILTIVVNCLQPNRTCFCSSMNTGPQASDGFDLSIIELDDAFLVEIGSDAGTTLVGSMEWEPASAYRLQIAEGELDRAEKAITRGINEPQLVADMLLANLDHRHWNEVGERCLSCTNCTQVCPTCFCWEVEDNNDLSGMNTKRERVWDSCFNVTFSAQAGGNTRPSTTSRYRQWLTHKMGSWVKQFGQSGCVGCGRCITWCPAKIDITEEIKALQEATR